jgi:hypothetical protein
LGSNGLAIHLNQIGFLLKEIGVARYAKKNKGRNNQQQHKEHHESPVLAYGI